MYQHFYGLNQLPFDSSLDGTCFFAGGQRQEILDALLYFTERGEKMVVITGEAGVGKTALIAALQLRLPDRTSRAQITGPYLMQQELQEALLSQLSIPSDFGDDKNSLLISYLQEVNSLAGTPLLLIVDDAHKLSQASLSFLLSLAGVNPSQQPLVQLMLFGLPDLSKMLLLLQQPSSADPATFRARLNSFSADELYFYLEQRLRCAGYQGESLFEPSVIKAIFTLTKGLPRVVNGMVDQLLMSGYAKGSRSISVADIQALGYPSNGQGFTYDHRQSAFGFLTRPPVLITLGASLVVGLSLLAGYVISDYLMINHNDKGEIGKDAIVNSVSIDPPTPASIMPLVDKSEPDPSTEMTSAITPASTNALPMVPPLALPSSPAPTNTASLTATPTAKQLQSEPLSKTPTPPAKPPVDNKEKTEKTTAKPTEPLAVAKKEEVKPPAQQKPTVTANKTTLDSLSESTQWPLANNWTKHHQETLSKLKQLKKQGATHTIQLLSDAWRSRDGFVGMAHSKLHTLPTQVAYLVDYQLDDGRPRVALVYGAYTSLEEAQAAVKGFSEEAKHYKPMLKKLDGVISQMEAFKPSE